ncbi:MAG: hypothetical protein PHQ35_00470 [Phycisphaerae bacterium]|nr:hypothetical protein [Phycisphaerae bacterium]MDD5381458.1 hypothetical protein [Phycisphaerae bacterium]
MEEGKKKIIMIGIIVACIVAAIVITVASQSGADGGIASIKRGTMIWIKCRSPKCENTWQMDKKDYFEYIEKNRSGMTVPGIVCPKCNEASGYRAEKCQKCDIIFERGTGNDLPDRCPKCGYSALEDMRKKARGDTSPATEKKK